jgi:TPR repeat protein
MRSAVALIVGLAWAGDALAQVDAGATAAAALHRECLEGNLPRCAALGMQYREGRGVTRDLAKSALYFLRACAEAPPNNPFCREAGFGMGLAEDSPGGRSDLAAAFAALAQSCTSGALHDCNVYGMVQLLGMTSAVVQSAERAAAMLSRACAGGIGAACGNLADAYLSGGDVDKDVKKAADLYAKACDQGFASGCTAVGTLIHVDKAIPGDAASAFPHFRKGCDGGDSTGCVAAGHFYANGEGVEKDMVAAARAFKKACDLRDVRGCQGLAVVYKQDPDGAAALFKKACGIDLQQCARYEAFLEGIRGGEMFRKRGN